MQEMPTAPAAPAWLRPEAMPGATYGAASRSHAWASSVDGCSRHFSPCFLSYVPSGMPFPGLAL